MSYHKVEHLKGTYVKCWWNCHLASKHQTSMKGEWWKAQSRQQILRSFFWCAAKILYKFCMKMFCEMAFLSFARKSHASCKKAARKIFMKLTPGFVSMRIPTESAGEILTFWSDKISSSRPSSMLISLAVIAFLAPALGPPWQKGYKTFFSVTDDGAK